MNEIPKSILEAFEEFNTFYYMNNQREVERSEKKWN